MLNQQEKDSQACRTEVVGAWREQLAAAGENPWLADMLLGHGERILRRFIAFYERLRALPSRARHTLRRKLALSMGSAALLLALSGLPVPVARAANIPVDGTVCTLADAITAAETDMAIGGCPTGSGADVLDITNDIILYTALPQITTEITIEGNGHTMQRVGAGVFPILHVDATGVNGGDLTLRDATISGGLAGGVVNSYGTLSIQGCIISGNSKNVGGGVTNREGTATIEDSTISGNSATDGAGVSNDGGTLTIEDSTISGNDASGTWGSGGGVHNSGDAGSVTIMRSTISDNDASGTWSSGGGVYNTSGAVSIEDSAISGNTATQGGGGLHNDGGSSTVDIVSSTISDNTAEGSYGGGVYNCGGTVRVEDSTISGNTTYLDGGGVYSNEGTVAVINSTISGNTATVGGGGAVYNWQAAIRIENSTISGNTASGLGGGVGNFDGTVTLSHCLISGNTSAAGANEVYNDDDDDDMVYADAYNLFGVSSETDAQAFDGFAPGGSDITATSDGTQPTALNAILAPLADNGGRTLTHALPPYTPAIHAGDPDFEPPPQFDQRGPGFYREISRIDIGAFEVQRPVGGATRPFRGVEYLAPAAGLLAALAGLAGSRIALARKRRT